MKVTDLNFYMDQYLLENIKTIAYNIKRDFDSVIIITGSGWTRVGKTVLGLQIAKYISWLTHTPFGNENVCFSGEELIDVANKLPPGSAIVLDEARAELATSKRYRDTSQVLLDFFAECGMLNHAIILIMPDYFELNKKLAVNRSICLINVTRGSEPVTLKDGSTVMRFTRGKYSFFTAKAKKQLYFIGRRNYDDYDAVKPTFTGDFSNTWVIDQKEYTERKVAFLHRERYTRPDAIKLRAVLHSLLDLIGPRKAAAMINERGWVITEEALNMFMLRTQPVLNQAKLPKGMSETEKKFIMPLALSRLSKVTSN
jgi:hypothetical protein